MSESDATLVRFSEIGLKGGNRPVFERRLRLNIQAMLRPRHTTSVKALRGRILVLHSHEESAAVQASLCKVCGIKSLSPAWRTEATPEAIDARALQVMDTLRRRHPTWRSYRVRVRRADKSYPARSVDIERTVGSTIGEANRDLVVDLEHADFEIGVDVRHEGCFVFGERLPGPGGLPVGSTGRVLGLLSGGIDSPVACFLGMKRGLEVPMVFFHSAEFTGDGPLHKVERLARILAAYQPKARLLVVPFGPAQVAITEHTAEPYRNLLYRRLMHRIAEPLAEQEGATTLLCGDTLGQVASQTLENLAVTEEATKLSLLRPLLTYDKEETISLARHLGTYETSIQPEPDCCTLFQPAHPKVRARLDDVHENEANLDMETLIGEALAGVRRLDCSIPGVAATP